MGLSDWLRDLLGPMSAVRDLARTQRVAALVPKETEYITVGLFHLLPDAWAFVGGVPAADRIATTSDWYRTPTASRRRSASRSSQVSGYALSVQPASAGP